MIKIRKATAEDAGFILDILSGNFHDNDLILSNLEGFVICEVGDEKCGCGCVKVSGEKGYVNWLVIREKDRRQKLGSAVMKALLNIADLKGAKQVYSKADCHDFLKSLKFEVVNEELPEEYYGFFSRGENCRLYKVSLEGYFGSCAQK